MIRRGPDPNSQAVGPWLSAAGNDSTHGPVSDGLGGATGTLWLDVSLTVCSVDVSASRPTMSIRIPIVRR